MINMKLSLRGILRIDPTNRATATLDFCEPIEISNSNTVRALQVIGAFIMNRRGVITSLSFFYIFRLTTPRTHRRVIAFLTQPIFPMKLS